MSKVRSNEVRIAQLLTVPGADGTTGLVGVGVEGIVYTWTGDGWLPLKMERATGSPREGGGDETL